MGLVLSTVWLVIGYVVAQTALNIWVALMCPNPVARAQERILRNPWGSFFLGAAIWTGAFLFWVVCVNAKLGPVQILGWLAATPMLALSVLGGAAMSQVIGARIQSRMRNDSPIAALVGGALLTVLGGLLPVLGWFVFLPLTGFMSIGAAFLSLVAPRRRAQAAQQSPAAAAQPAGFIFPEQTAPSA